MSRTIDDDTWEVLNALADGELAGDARTDLEHRLAHEPELVAALSEIRALKETLADTEPWGALDGARRPPAFPAAPTPGGKLRTGRPRFALPLAALILGTLVLGTMLVLRDEMPGAPDTLVAQTVAALPAGLHAALHEPIAADAMSPPPAEPDGSRLLAGYRFPDLEDHGIRPARSLTRDTPAGATAATLYLGPNGCEFTLSAAPDSLAAMLPATDVSSVEADVGAASEAGPDTPKATIDFTAGFGHAVLVRAWNADDTVWVASSNAIDPMRFAALAALAAERTSAISTTDAVVRIARVDGSTGRTSCAAG